MKHVKLFEEFTEKYKLLKPLPENGMMLIPVDNDMNCVLQTTLFKMGFKWGGSVDGNKDFDQSIKKGPNHKVEWYIIWQRDRKDSKGDHIKNSLLFTSNPETTTFNIGFEDTLLDFNDYFELKPEFRGHKLKKYNV